MDLIAFPQSIWSYFLQLSSAEQLLVVSSALILLGTPISVHGAFKSRKLGMPAAFRQQLICTTGLFLVAVGMIAGHLSEGQLGDIGLGIVLIGTAVLYASFAFSSRARKERAAYHDSILKREQPVAYAPTNSWPPAPTVNR